MKSDYWGHKEQQQRTKSTHLMDPQRQTEMEPGHQRDCGCTGKKIRLAVTSLLL